MSEKFLLMYRIFTRRIDWQRLMPVLALLISLSATMSSLYYRSHPTTPETFRGRITRVESALSSLKDLERDLESMKKDILLIQQQKEDLEQQVEYAKSLQSVTEEQIKSIRYKLNPPKTFKDYFIDQGSAFALGIASSVVGAFLIDKLRK